VILYFLRHGDAGHAWAANDEARPLSEKGEAALQAAAATWTRVKLRPEVVITSPLVRARQTAELLCAGIRCGAPPIVDERLRPGAGWGDVARAVADHPAAARVCFVGNEPDFSQVVSILTGASSVRMRKGGLACIEFYGVPEPGAGELAWLIDPDLYTG